MSTFYRDKFNSTDLDEVIDFVIIWVDGNDTKWQKEKSKYSRANLSQYDSAFRYRDWDNLQYWFRGVEKFTPWVHKIYFVTYGHLPSWLDVSNPKLNIVKHQDYIPHEYLPTFSSHPIELNLHRIKGLSERFVYFNDDTFIIKPMSKTDFFFDGLPCDQMGLGCVTALDGTSIFPHILLNVIGAINKNFHKRDVIKHNIPKLFSTNYSPTTIMKNLMLLPYGHLFGFTWHHLPAAFLKTTFKQVWRAEPELLNETSSHKFRDTRDVNQYLFRSWQFVTGNFSPKDFNKQGKSFMDISSQKEDLFSTIRNQRYAMICANDSSSCEYFEETRDEFKTVLNEILPDKSSFEL
jgi:hypothetical protein